MKTLFSRWRRDERGASAIEFALLAPILLVVLIGTVTLFDMFRNAQNVEKATFTVGDILSRQTTVSQTQLTGLLSLVKHMVGTADDGGLRVSSISKASGTLKLDWSKVVGNAVIVTGQAIPYDLVPDMADGDSVLLTESFVPHGAFAQGFGLDNITFKNRSVHRPRFVSAIKFQ